MYAINWHIEFDSPPPEKGVRPEMQNAKNNRLVLIKMMKGILMAGLISMIMNLFVKSGAVAKENEPADIFIKLRYQALNITAEQLNINSHDPKKLLGVLMETGYEKAVATLVTIVDGTVSMYFSNGGGFIGVGQHEGPRKACESFLSFAPSYIEKATLTNDFPLPAQGYTRFYFITIGGIYKVEAKESDLGSRNNLLSPLYFKAQDVITQVRLADEKVRGSKGNSFPQNTETTIKLILASAAQNDFEGLQKFIESGVDPNLCDDTGLTPLMSAAYKGNQKIIKMLHMAKCEIDKKDSSGCTALSFACNKGKFDCVKLLVDFGANVNTKDNDNSTPIMFAAQHGFNDVVKYLLSKGADPHFKGYHGLNAIGFAKQNNFKETLRILESSK